MKRKMLAVLVIFCLAGAMVFAAGQSESEDVKPIIIKASHSDATGQITDQNFQLFKQIVEEKSGGRLEVQIYPSNQLGSEEEVIQALGRGSIEMGHVYTGNIVPFAPSLGVLQLPYLFGSGDEFMKTYQLIKDDINEVLIKEANVRALAYHERGPRVLSNSKKPVKTMEDLKGLKIRVGQIPLTIDTFKAWGLDPVPMAWSEVFPALQQKVIDGQENPYTTLFQQKFYEVQKYVTEITYALWTGPILISETFFQSLPEDLQQILVEAGDEATKAHAEAFAIMDKESREGCLANGMVLQGPPDDVELWEERARSIWPKYYDQVGGEDWVNYVLSKKDEATK